MAGLFSWDIGTAPPPISRTPYWRRSADAPLNPVAVLGVSSGDGTVQAVIDKLNELIYALYR
jgi:hypothetical protein